MHPGFESRESHNFFYVFFFFFFFLSFVTVHYFFGHLLQCKFNITVSTQILLVYYPL